MRTSGIVSSLVLWACAGSAWAQIPSGGGAATPQPVILPASGRNNQGGSVNSAEQSVPGITTSVNTLNPSVSISGPYTGSRRSTTAMPFSGKLSLEEALKRGLAYNLGSVGIGNTAHQNSAQVLVARSALLPNINGNLSETVAQSDLAALGLRISSPFPGFRIPTVAGPFNYFALQATLSQTLFNMTSLENYRSAKATARASQYSVDDARDLVTLAVGGAYLQVLTAQARLDSAQAQLNTANAVFHRSTEQHSSGVLSRLNVDQSEVQTLTQQQQIITLRNDLAKQKINLARLTGLAPNPDYELTDTFPFSPAPVESVGDAVARAEQQRSDLKAAQTQVEAAARALSAAKAERLPSLSVGGYYEAIGTNPAESHGAFNVAGTLNIPIWQGGKMSADIAQAQAVLAQRQAELEDTRGQIEAEIREAFLDLEASAGQVEVARKNLQVAQETLEMARARMEAGVINTVEVVQAQQTVSTAQLDLINSIFAHNLAKLTLARDTGHAFEQLPALLKPQAK
ncbi:MAG TPA: TolC family protein [Bryobacteraceae bacterium]|jgi:outer membrane protein TolC|nr:TolC family protein [Bryobacteraceae bacterium]